MTDSAPLTYTEALQQTPLPTRLNRAKQHYATRLQQLHADSTELSKLHASYKQLSAQLVTLPRRLRSAQRVPFGPLASFKGRLVHTNEWLVLLGGEWWLECTADRARRIAGDRLAEVERRQGRVGEEEKRVREWMEEGDKVLGEAGGRRMDEEEGAEGDEIVEIKEEYREVEEEEDRREHDMDSPTTSEGGVSSRRADSVKAAAGMSDAEFDAYWDKLAELEEEEESRGGSGDKAEQKQSRTVPMRHTAHERQAAAEQADEQPVALPAIRSPADIYKHMQQAAAAPQQPQQSKQASSQPAASQRKRVSFSSAQPAVAFIDPVSTRSVRQHTHSPPPPGASLLSPATATSAVAPPSSNAALAGAFSGAVLERDLDGEDGVAMPQLAAPKKKMSRFMAERLGVAFEED